MKILYWCLGLIPLVDIDMIAILIGFSCGIGLPTLCD